MAVRFLSSENIDGSVLISNDEFYKAKNTSGTSYKIAGITSGNVIQIGAIDYTSAGTIFAGGDNISITTGGASGATRIKINSSGNVGIGTTSLGTEAKLAIGHTSTSEGGQIVLHKGTSGTYAPHLDAYTSGGIDYLRILKGTNTATSAAPFVFDLTNDRLGIGTASPDYKLDIRSGELTVRSGSSGNGGLAKLGNSSSNAILQLYDSSGNEDVRISTSLSSYFNGGNVGIGEQNPQNPLHLYKNASQGNPSSHTPANATLRISDSANTMYFDGNSIIQTGAASFTFGNTQASDIIFYTNATERMRIDSDGALLVGDNVAPSTVWEGVGVFGESGNKKVIIGHLEASVLGENIVGGHNSALDAWDDLTIAGNVLKFRTSTSIVERMRIDSSGNVGIGTTSVNSRLQVRIGGIGSNANDEVDGVIFEGDRHDLIFKQIRTAASSDWNSTTFRLQNRVDTTLMSSIDFVTDASFQRHIDINTASNSFNTRFAQGGDVGIGTTSMQGRLTVVGATQTIVADLDANTSVGLSVMGVSSTNFNAITLGSANSTNNCGVIRFKYVGAGSTNNYMGLGFYANDDILTVKGNGRVGINQNNPESELHVEGAGGDGAAILRLIAATTGGTFNWASSTVYPNIGTGKTIINLFGHAQSYNNQAYIGFKYAGSGSTSNQLTFGFYGNDFLVNLLANGNVGIGTQSPNDGDLTINAPKLHVVGPSTAGVYNLAARFQGGNDSDNTGSAILINHSNDRGLLIKAGRKDGDREVAYFDVISSGANITNMLTMGKFGSDYNVGIGTQSPTAKLEIVGSNGTNIFRGNFGGSADIFMGFDNANPYLTLQDNSNVTTHLFQSNVNNYIVNSNVGIGVTSPSFKTHFRGGSNTEETVLKLDKSSYADTGGHTTILGFGNEPAGWAKGGIGYERTGSYDRGKIHFLQENTGNTDTVTLSDSVMTIQPDGYVGIGTTSPSDKLEVTTSASQYTGRFDYTGSSGGAYGCLKLRISANTSPSFIDLFYDGYSTNPLTPVGAIVTTGSSVLYSSFSDYRLKENVADLTGALDKVNSLQPKTFNYINRPEATNEGFLAHELQEIVPQAVSGTKDGVDEDGNPKYQGVDNAHLVPLLVGAIKELKAEIENLKSQIQ